jgi:hypothetical protein
MVKSAVGGCIARSGTSLVMGVCDPAAFHTFGEDLTWQPPGEFGLVDVAAGQALEGARLRILQPSDWEAEVTPLGNRTHLWYRLDPRTGWPNPPPGEWAQIRQLKNPNFCVGIDVRDGHIALWPCAFDRHQIWRIQVV